MTSGWNKQIYEGARPTYDGAWLTYEGAWPTYEGVWLTYVRMRYAKKDVQKESRNSNAQVNLNMRYCSRDKLIRIEYLRVRSEPFVFIGA